MTERGVVMKRMSDWFDRHPKTRIALQLMLDAVIERETRKK